MPRNPRAINHCKCEYKLRIGCGLVLLQVGVRRRPSTPTVFATLCVLGPTRNPHWRKGQRRTSPQHKSQNPPRSAEGANHGYRLPATKSCTSLLCLLSSWPLAQKKSPNLWKPPKSRLFGVHGCSHEAAHDTPKESGDALPLRFRV